MDHVLRLGRELNCGVPMIKTFLSLLLSSLVFADIHAACADGEYVCVDGPGSKYVDGVEVYRECWNYQFRRSCNEAAEVNYCAALEQIFPELVLDGNKDFLARKKSLRKKMWNS